MIVCEAPPLTRNHYLVMAKRLGVEDRLLIPGFVPEEVLVSLYQCAELAVFPSLYEGYGLPVVESMACGAPTMAGDNSSLQEILPRDARFQPSDPGAIAEAIVRGLTDKPFRERLLALADQRPPTWDAVADKAAGVFEDLLRRSSRYRPGWRRRPQFALIGLPGAGGCRVRVRQRGPLRAREPTAAEHPTNAEAKAKAGQGDRRRRPARGHGYEGVRRAAALERPAQDRPLAGRLRRHRRLGTRNAGQAAEVMEALASEWPGRVVALFDQPCCRPRRPTDHFRSTGVATVMVPSRTCELGGARPLGSPTAAQGRTW